MTREQRELRAMRTQVRRELDQSVVTFERTGGAIIRRHRLLTLGGSVLLGGVTGYVAAATSGRRRAIWRRIVVITRSLAVASVSRLLRDQRSP